MSEVLIVDDDHNFRETLRELLSNAGYQTRIATNAEEGIALLQTTTPDLTLCDWKMPGGGGEQFLKSLQRKRLTWQQVGALRHSTTKGEPVGGDEVSCAGDSGVLFSGVGSGNFGASLSVNPGILTYLKVSLSTPGKFIWCLAKSHVSISPLFLKMMVLEGK